MNQTTRRYPRTMQEAFGPYTSSNIQEEYPQMPQADKIVLASCAVAAFVLAAFAAVGWI